MLIFCFVSLFPIHHFIIFLVAFIFFFILICLETVVFLETG
jgi:hypothetical protein